MLNFTNSKSIDFLEGIYWGIAIGIGILLLMLLVKWFVKKQIENETNKLKEHNLSLIRANNSLERFAYITSHNLRAPVTNLISLTELQKNNSLTNESKAEISDKIYECVIQLDSTLNDLVELIASKPGENIKSENLDLQTEFDKVLYSIDSQVQQSELRMETNFSERSQIYFPKQFLNSILLNLLTNSIKYKSDDRKLVVQIKTENKMGQTILHFSDNGMGIDLKKFGDKLFGLYQRFHSEIEGKGMGLYIIKSQVEAMGGKIEVDSIPNQGTSFRIYFNSKKEA
jgi:signal transduction histidine kinase